jgi:hypothetical protein
MVEVGMKGVKQTVFATLGWALLLIGFLILLLPGPLGWPGIPPMIVGAMLVLASSRGAKRWFLNAAKQEPKMFGRLRGWLRKRSTQRFYKRQTREGQSQ